MSLYRNWRPRSFADLVGQDAVVRTLSQALRSGRLVHAYLFSGPRGSGKTSAAKIFARCITCELGPTPEPDNTCVHCQAILAGTALDVIEIDAASNRGIDEIRALRDAVKFAPSTMRKKVYIVDEAHMLTKEGANAFLKTLEEPPAHVVFILATTAPESLPVTILSRCQRFAFRRIPTAVMVDRMQHIADAEKISIAPAALQTIAYRADGGLRDALTMLEQVAAFGDGTIDLATVEAAFGATGRAYAQLIIDAFIAGNAVEVLRAIEAASDAGTDINNLMRALIAEIRHVVMARIDSTLLRGDLIEDDIKIAQARAHVLSQVRALRALRLLSEAVASARTSGNPRLELEAAMLRLTLQGEDPTVDALAARVRQLEDALAGGSMPITASTVAPPLATTSAAAAATAPTALAETATAKRAASTKAPRKASTATTTDATATATTTADVKSAPTPLPEPTPISEPTSERSSAIAQAAAAPAAPTPAPSRANSAPSPYGAPPLGPGAAPAPAPLAAELDDAAPAPASNEPPTLQKVRSLWPSVSARAESVTPSLRGPLSRATIDSIDGWKLHLSLSDEYNAGFLRDRLKVLETALGDVLGGECQVVLRVGGGAAARAAKKAVEDEPAPATLGLLDYAAKRLG